ncbi:MAG: hypothetical protein V4559_00480 [Pseudomonadota bacterium]
MFRIAVAILGIALAAPAFAADPAPPKPSFDCATAKSKVKLLICGSDDLARLDIAEEALLRRARAKATAPDAVNEEQSLWLSRRDACTSAACLVRAYQQRIEDLHAWTN